MKKILIAVMAVAILGIGAGQIFATPGDSNDPVITLSYIQSVLMPEIAKKAESVAAPTFQVIDVENGKKVICEAGTEFILRKGKATVISTEKGGIANVTAGTDLKDGEQVPSNSLLIVPLSDGRGVIANNDIILMVKGKYVIE